MQNDDHLREQVQQALHHFHDLAYLDRCPLSTWNLVWQQTTADHSAPQPAAIGQAVQELLSQTIDLLKPTALPPDFTAPPWRFYHILDLTYRQNQPIQSILSQLHISRAHYYRERKRAIAALGNLLYEREQRAQAQAAVQSGKPPPWQNNLPPPTYTRLFGATPWLAAILDALRDPDRRWLVVVDGLGGVGKTALAREAARQALEAGDWETLTWTTAQRQIFRWGEIQLDLEPALTVDRLLDSIASQLGLPYLAYAPTGEKRRALQAALRERPTLLVVDNLETAEDYQSVAQELRALTNPSKVLVTSRHRLDRYDMTTSIHLHPLDEKAAGDFIRYHAQERGVKALQEADDQVVGLVYRATGGNPLAIKLVVGQARRRPLNQVLDHLAQASGDTMQLYHFIYWASWEILSQPARQVLLSMPYLSTRGGPWEAVAAISGVPEETLAQAVDELVGLSLLDAGGDLEKRYSIHQLTRNFVLSELVGIAANSE